ncbi:MAG TPA: ATP-binding protein [Arenimonas sp.]|nr:ATP-binding protein [Arenimonas sp.]
MEAGNSGKFRHQINNGLLALAFVLILATSAVSVTSTNELGASIGLVSHTHQTLELLTRMKVATGDAQANGLRYLITGESANQLAQRKALAEMYALKVQLGTIVSDNALQRSYMADFGELYDAFLARSMESMAYKQKALKTGNETAFVKRIKEGVGFSMIKNMREVLDKMTAEENRLMILRVEERDTLVKQTNATVLIANALALVAGVIGFTAIRRSQDESKKMLMVELRAEQARQASEEKSSFLANMSHEIRTPMNAIFGFTQLLSESVTAPVERDWVRSIKKSGQMLLALINDVLDLSKIEAGKLQLQLQPTDLRELSDEIVEMFLPDAREKGIYLRHEIDTALNEPLLLDGQRVRQILMNLLSNAIKYTEHGGVIVRMIVTPQHDPLLRNLRLFVTDSGVGIDPEQLVKIFEPFHQADSPDGKIRQGTGLGLSICRRLVNAMQGDIQVSSELGRGSTFVVDIRNVRVSDIRPDSNKANDNRVDFNKLRPLKILVVDDVEWNTEIAQGFLRNSHHEVHIANNGLDAVDIAKELKPDVVLMDLRMQGMNGFEASDAIRSDPGLQDVRIEIVAVTASSLHSEEKALRESFDGYVRKPYTPLDLFNALDNLFGNNAAIPKKADGVPGKWSEKEQGQWLQLQGKNLRELQKSMRMREIGDYAKKLRQFSADTEFAVLEEHAGTLFDAVQRFDVAGVNETLSTIAAMPETFDAR